MPSLTPPPGWEVINNHHLHRVYKFPDFKQALDFVNKVGAIAEAQQHHPDISLTWGKVEITTYSHDVNGLTNRDVKLATSINELG